MNHRISKGGPEISITHREYIQPTSYVESMQSQYIAGKHKNMSSSSCLDNQPNALFLSSLRSLNAPPPSSLSLSLCAQVDRQSQFVQGYRLLYRPSGGTWVLQDVNSPLERTSVLGDLLKGTKYEFKIRPYFDEFQGRDSRVVTLRTPEEGEEEKWDLNIRGQGCQTCGRGPDVESILSNIGQVKILESYRGSDIREE